MGLNFGGNHTLANDPRIWLPTSWIRDRGDGTVVDHRATEKGRGKSSSRWPVQEIVARGYAVAYHIRTGKHDLTLYHWQCYIDFADQQFEREK